MFTVISLFDGMSCGQLALNDMGIKYDKYYASEVDKYAISVTQDNYPNTIQVGDVTKLVVKKYRSGVRLITEDGRRYFIKGKIILLGGSPCQGFSFAGKQLGASTKCKIEITTLEQYLKLKDDGFEFEGQSYLFWEYIRILREIDPELFLLENVQMNKKWLSMFNEAVGVDPIMINSSLVSAQNRKRWYWTNIQGIEQPEDEGIVITDILEDVVDEKYYMNNIQVSRLQKSDSKFTGSTDLLFHKKGFRRNSQVYGMKGKTECLDTCGGGRQPHVLVNVNPSGKGQNGNVYSSSKQSPTLTTNKGEGIKVLLVPEATKKGYTVVNNNNNCFDGTQLNSKTRRGRDMSKKSNCLTTSPQYYRYEHPRVRKLTPLECERLQTVPDNYTKLVSNSQRYKMLGNGWTIKIVAHILTPLKNKW